MTKKLPQHPDAPRKIAFRRMPCVKPDWSQCDCARGPDRFEFEAKEVVESMCKRVPDGTDAVDAAGRML
jgi:hypothetical protein